MINMQMSQCHALQLEAVAGNGIEDGIGFASGVKDNGIPAVVNDVAVRLEHAKGKGDNRHAARSFHREGHGFAAM
jgi:hypothetical protein